MIELRRFPHISPHTPCCAHLHTLREVCYLLSLEACSRRSFATAAARAIISHGFPLAVAVPHSNQSKSINMYQSINHRCHNKATRGQRRSHIPVPAPPQGAANPASRSDAGRLHSNQSKSINTNQFLKSDTRAAKRSPSQHRHGPRGAANTASRSNAGLVRGLNHSIKVPHAPHAGKGEATSQHNHRGQQTLRHEVTQAWGGLKISNSRSESRYLGCTYSDEPTHKHGLNRCARAPG